MNKRMELDEKEEKKRRAPKLRLITGGKGPSGPNWLRGLKEGSVFLVRDNSTSEFALGQFHVLEKTDKAVLLFTNLNQEQYIWVEPVRFSARFELIEVLQEGPPNG